MTFVLEILRFLFGAGWMMLWNIPFLLGTGMFVIGPLAMLANDALKVPVPTASLGTFGSMMLIAVFLAAITPVGVGALLRSGGMSPGWTILAALGAGAVICVAAFMIIGAMAQHGGRMWVALAWTFVVGTVVGHLAMMYVATGRSTPAVP